MHTRGAWPRAAGAIAIIGLLAGPTVAGCSGGGDAGTRSTTSRATSGSGATSAASTTGRPTAPVTDGRCLTAPPAVTEEDPVTFLALPTKAPITPLTADTKSELRGVGLDWMIRPGMRQIDLESLILVGDLTDEGMRTTAQELNSATKTVSSLLGTGIDRGRELVLAPRSVRDYERLYAGDAGGPEGETEADDPGQDSLGFFNWPVLAISPAARTEDPGGQLSLSVTTHELTHLATDPEDDTPGWLVEGYAVISEELIDPVVREVNDDLVTSAGRRLPADDDFVGEDGDNAYAQSASFVRYLCGLKGVRALSDFVVKVSAGWNVEDRAKAVYGKDVKSLERDWRKAA